MTVLEELEELALELCYSIESLPASEKQTECIEKASLLRRRLKWCAEEFKKGVH